MRLILPYQQLDPTTLERLLEEIVTRDGTDYGAAEHSTRGKVEAAKLILRQGSAVLTWDTEMESANLVPSRELHGLKQGAAVEGD